MSDRITIKEESIEGVIPCTNHVLVKVNEIDCMKDGLYVANAEWDNDGSTVTRFGTVIALPSQLYHRKGNGQFGLEWDTTMELQVGDKAYFGIMQGTDCPRILVNDEVYYLVDYAEIRVAVRDGVIFPLNGFIVVEEYTEVLKSKFLITEPWRKSNHKKGVVKYVGSRNKSYYHSDQDTFDPQMLNVGDTVLLMINAWCRLEDSRFSSLENNLGYIQGRWVIAKLN